MRRLIFVLLALLAAPPVRAATLTVTNLNDAFAGSLRQAIQDAAPGDTIGFAAGLTGTIPVTSSYLQLMKPLTIAGPGAGLLALSGNDTNRILAVFNGELRISGLTFRNGNWNDGAGIYNGDTLKVTRCTFSNNRSLNGGAAINSDQLLEVTECTFDNNRADNGSGSAIRCGGYSTINACTFRANVGSAVVGIKSLLVENSTFFGNSGSTGGALTLLGSPEVVSNCVRSFS